MAKGMPIGILLIRVAAFAATLVYLLFWNFAAMVGIYSSTTLKTAAFFVMEALMVCVALLSCVRLLRAIVPYLGLTVLFILILTDFDFELWMNEPTRDFWGFMYLLLPFAVGVLFLAMNRGVVLTTQSKYGSSGQRND